MVLKMVCQLIENLVLNEFLLTSFNFIILLQILSETQGALNAICKLPTMTVLGSYQQVRTVSPKPRFWRPIGGLFKAFKGDYRNFFSINFVQFSMGLPVFGRLFDAHYSNFWKLFLATLGKNCRIKGGVNKNFFFNISSAVTFKLLL